jgi:stage II sporulation protein GA (sporulation sigma-E factor processing peptidase)
VILTKKSRRFFYTCFWEVVILEIYLDVIFLENLLMDYILLALMGKLLRRKCRRIRVFLAAVAGSGYSVLYFAWLVRLDSSWTWLVCLITAVLAGSFMLFLAFAPTDGKDWIVLSCCFVGVSAAMEGILRLLGKMFPRAACEKYPLLWLTGMFLFGAAFLQTFLEQYREKRSRESYIESVQLVIGGQSISCRGLWDSGNSLIEPITHKPAVIAERSMLQRNHVRLPKQGVFMIPYHAIGTESGMLTGILAEEMTVSGEQGEKHYHKVMLAIYEGSLSKKGEYQVILHPKL